MESNQKDALATQEGACGTAQRPVLCRAPLRALCPIRATIQKGAVSRQVFSVFL